MTLGVEQFRPQTEIADSPGFKEQLLEVLTFCFLIVPGLAFSFLAGTPVEENYLLSAFAVLLNDLALVALVLFFLWHNGESVRKIGWVKQNCIREIILGVILFIPLVYALSYVQSWLQSLGLPAPPRHLPSVLKPTGLIQQIAAALLVIVVAVSEETIFRGYLILRFKSVTHSAVWSIVLSSFIFSIGHGYEGITNVIIIGIMGAVFGVIFLWRKSLIAPMVMHFLQDFIAIVLVPALTHQ